MLSRFFLKSRPRLNPMTYYRVMHVSKVGQEGSSLTRNPPTPRPCQSNSGRYQGSSIQAATDTGDQMAGLSLGRIFCTFLRTLCNLTHFYNLPKIYLYTFQVHVNQPCFENSFICFPYINLFLFCVSWFNIFSPFPRINDEGTSWLSLASLTFQQNDFFELKKSVIWLFSFLYLDTL